MNNIKMYVILSAFGGIIILEENFKFLFKKFECGQGKRIACAYLLNNQYHILQKKHIYPGHEMLPLGCVSFLIVAICYNGKNISDASGSIWQGTARFSITWSLQGDRCCSSCFFFLQKLQCTENVKLQQQQDLHLFIPN